MSKSPATSEISMTGGQAMMASPRPLVTRRRLPLTVSPGTLLAPPTTLDAEVRIARAGPRWTAVALVETPWGPVLLTASASERKIKKTLAASLGPQVGFSFGGLFRKIGNVARSIAKSSIVKSIAHQVSKLAHNPIVEAAIRLHTSVLKLAKGALKGVTNNPLWNIAATGLSFIPGIGQAVSAGMAAAAALGRGMNLKDAALAAARNALPGGPLAAAAFAAARG